MLHRLTCCHLSYCLKLQMKRPKPKAKQNKANPPQHGNGWGALPSRRRVFEFCKAVHLNKTWAQRWRWRDQFWFFVKRKRMKADKRWGGAIKIEKKIHFTWRLGNSDFSMWGYPLLSWHLWWGSRTHCLGLVTGLLLKLLQCCYKWVEPHSLFLGISPCRVLLSARAAGKGEAGGVRMLKWKQFYLGTL